MGISLAVLASVVVSASAQPPLAIPAVPVPPASQPAIGNTPGPVSKQTPPDARPPAPKPVPSRVVLFQKPASDTQPNGKTENYTKPAQTPEKPAIPTASPPPGGRSRQDMARLEGDDQLLRRIAQELKAEDKERHKDDPSWREPDESFFKMPTVDPLVPAGTPYSTKAVREAYPAMRSLIEPNYVVHRRMYFEEKNSERYGWDAGISQPIFSALYFYKDVLFWPAKLASNPFERYDSSAGKCLPGSPVPYYLYPPEVDLFGATVGAATIVGVAAILP